jgi:hypothetical protein
LIIPLGRGGIAFVVSARLLAADLVMVVVVVVIEDVFFVTR